MRVIDPGSPDELLEREELDQITAFAGFSPAADVLFCAGCNSDEDHRILGELVLACAVELTGIVSYDGNLVTLPDSERRTLRGRSKRVIVEPNNPKTGYIIADTQFHKEWLDHDSFRMVK
jgi:hypothetical protein